VKFVDVNSDRIAQRINLGMCTGMEHIYYSATVAEAEVLISMPKFKTHHWAGVTLSLKNLFGTLPGICYGWPKNELHHRGIENSIIDIALTRTPELAVVDGIIGMEGDGPLNGAPARCAVPARRRPAASPRRGRIKSFGREPAATCANDPRPLRGLQRGGGGPREQRGRSDRRKPV
jgi:hypothetical protein